MVHERTGTTVGLPQRDGNEQALDVASDQLELRVEGSYVHYSTTNQEPAKAIAEKPTENTV